MSWLVRKRPSIVDGAHSWWRVTTTTVDGWARSFFIPANRRLSCWPHLPADQYWFTVSVVPVVLQGLWRLPAFPSLMETLRWWWWPSFGVIIQHYPSRQDGEMMRYGEMEIGKGGSCRARNICWYCLIIFVDCQDLLTMKNCKPGGRRGHPKQWTQYSARKANGKRIRIEITRYSQVVSRHGTRNCRDHKGRVKPVRA